ncbi:MAG: cell division protein ZapA [Treponema sp.]|nr:cell division protein ZapA [Treponema sp.]MBQ4235923.1 cell division protein ZapA [Treponema sp.]MBQ5384919.1 cell division protein ZapA [Treponema sp.]
MGKIQVNMLGTKFTVRGNEDEAHLNRLYSYYKEITQTIQISKKLDNPLQISILAGITLVDELLKEKTQNIVNSKSSSDAVEGRIAERLTSDMISKIDDVL